MPRGRKGTKSPQPAPSGGRPPAYPSIREHLLSRRDVLSYLGVSVFTGVCALSKGCGMGEPNASGQVGDGSTTYLTTRVPQQGDLLVALADAGQCRFFVNALTYHQDTYDYFTSHEAEAEQACTDTMGQLTHASLSTVAGILEAETFLRDALNTLSTGVAQATLSIVGLQQ